MTISFAFQNAYHKAKTMLSGEHSQQKRWGQLRRTFAKLALRVGKNKVASRRPGDEIPCTVRPSKQRQKEVNRNPFSDATMSVSIRRDLPKAGATIWKPIVLS